MIVIDVHTHMYSHAWFDLLKAKGKPRYTVKPGQQIRLQGCGS